MLKDLHIRLKAGDRFRQAYRTKEPMMFEVLYVDRERNKVSVVCTSHEGHTHNEVWDDLDTTEMAFDIGEYKMID